MWCWHFEHVILLHPSVLKNSTPHFGPRQVRSRALVMASSTARRFLVPASLSTSSHRATVGWAAFPHSRQLALPQPPRLGGQWKVEACVSSS